jgi:phosphomannomutase
MVTGSRIPNDRNGIKFYRPDGEIDKKDEAGIAAIAAVLDKGPIEFAPATAQDRAAAAVALFMERNKALLPVGSLSGLVIGVYQHSTVARDPFVSVLKHFGAEVVALGRSESFVPVDTEAVSAETIQLLKGWAKEYRLDAIVSADGDGDRPLVADETGEPLRGDLLGLIAAKFLGADTLVTPVTSNSGIEAAGEFAVIRTRVGSPFVIAGMQEALAAGRSKVVGFEANGGTLTGSAFTVAGGPLLPLPNSDSFLPALAALHLRGERRELLSSIAASFTLASAAADRLENFPVETSAALMAHLRASNDILAAFLAPLGTIAMTSNIDGLRVTLTDGRIVHLRPSGNAPEMRCYVEADSEMDAKLLLAECLGMMHAWAANCNSC